MEDDEGRMEGIGEDDITWLTDRVQLCDNGRPPEGLKAVAPRYRVKRNALNRGTAVHLGGSRVRFIWACGCTKVETIRTPVGELDHRAVAGLVKNWRLNGCVLGQCGKHPDWYSKLSQIERLNEEHPE